MGHGHRSAYHAGTCPFIVPRMPLGHELASRPRLRRAPRGVQRRRSISHWRKLEREARGVIGEMAYAYFAGGAATTSGSPRNIEAGARRQLHPRVLAGRGRRGRRRPDYHAAGHGCQLSRGRCAHRGAAPGPRGGRDRHRSWLGRRRGLDGAVVARQLLARRGGRGSPPALPAGCRCTSCGDRARTVELVQPRRRGR